MLLRHSSLFTLSGSNSDLPSGIGKVFLLEMAAKRPSSCGKGSERPPSAVVPAAAAFAVVAGGGSVNGAQCD